MSLFHLSGDIIHGWPLLATPPSGIRFVPAITRFSDDPNKDRSSDVDIWPESPGEEWARRILRDVPATFDGLVMLDNEGPQYDALWAPLGKVLDPKRRKIAVSAMCRQLDACRRVRPNAGFSVFGLPIAGWYAPPMYEQSRRYAREANEIYIHSDVIMASVYCPETTPGHEGYAEYIMDMAYDIARRSGRQLAPVVGTRCYALGNDKAPLISEKVLRPWMKVVMKYRPQHLIYWQSEVTFVPLHKRIALKRALTEDEKAVSRDEASRNLEWGLKFFRQYASY